MNVIDFSKYRYSDIEQIFCKILLIQDNSMNIIEGLTQSLVTNEKTVTIRIRNEKNQIIEKIIPSLYYYTDKVLNLEKTLERLKSEKILEYDEVKHSNLKVYVEPDNIKTPAKIMQSSIGLEENTMFKNFWEKLFTVELDLTNTINPLAKELKIKVLSFNVNDLSESDLDKLSENTTLSNITGILDKENIKYNIKESVLNLAKIRTKESGEFEIKEIIKNNTESIINGNVLYVKDIVLNHNTIKTREGDTFSTRKIVAEDVLVKDIFNTYEVVENLIDTSNNNRFIYRVQSTTNTVALNVGDILHIRSAILNDRKFKYKINPNRFEIIYYKEISPNLSIESDMYSKEGTVINPKKIIPPKELTYNKEMSVYDFANKFLYDYSEYFKDLHSEIIIPMSAAIKPNTPILNKDMFKVYRIVNTNIDADTEVEELLKKYNFLMERIKQIEEGILLINTKIDDELVKGSSSDSPIIINLNEEKKELENIAKTVNEDLDKVKKDISARNYKIPSNLTATYEVMGAWEIPDAKIDERGRVQDIIQFEIEISKLDAKHNQLCTPSLNFITMDNLRSDLTSINPPSNNDNTENNENQNNINNVNNIIERVNKLMFPRQKVYLSQVRNKVFDNLTNKYVWEYKNKNNDTFGINNIQYRIRPYEVLQIRIRAISEVGFPKMIEGKNVSDWSNPIILEFPNEYNKLDTLQREKDTILHNINNTINNNDNSISMNRKIKELESKFNNQIIELKKEISRTQDRISSPNLHTFVFTNEIKTITKMYRIPENISNIMNLDTIILINSENGSILVRGRDYSYDNLNKVIVFTDTLCESVDVNSQINLVVF